jgi:prefoldin subunit 5
MLGRERDRLEKEIFALDKRRSTAQSKLDLINQRLEKLQKETHEAQKIRTHKSAPTRPVKTMSMNY